MKSKRLFLVIATIVLLTPASYAKVNEDFREGVAGGYLKAYCAMMCRLCATACYCPERYWRPQPPCATVAYEEVVDCTEKCIITAWRSEDDENEKSYEIDEVIALMNGCKACENIVECKPDGRVLCNAIKTRRDIAEFFLNVDYNRTESNYCPKGAVLSADKERPVCKCPEGTELNDMHTTCLNKEVIKENINKVLSYIPDEVRDAVIDNLNLTTEVGGIIKFMPNSYFDSVLSELIYNSIIKDTQTLRRLIKTLGRKGTEKLVETIGLILKPDVESTLSTSITAMRESTISKQSETQMSQQEAIDRYQRTNEEVLKLCQEEYNTCAKRDCPDAKSPIACLFSCSIAAGCGDCRQDSDCSKYAALIGTTDAAFAGYKTKCSLYITNKCGIERPELEPLKKMKQLT